MTIERRTEVIPAGGQYVVGGGTLFRLLTTSAALTVDVVRGGTREHLTGMVALILKRVLPWDKIVLIGTPGDTFEFFYGTENVTEDETDVPVASFSITGAAVVQERPSDTVSDLAPVTIPNGNAQSVIPASATRRRFRLQADSLNPGSCYARTSAGGNNIRELVAGVEYAFDTFDEIFVRNDTGGDCTFYRFEET